MLTKSSQIAFKSTLWIKRLTLYITIPMHANSTDLVDIQYEHVALTLIILIQALILVPNSQFEIIVAITNLANHPTAPASQGSFHLDCHFDGRCLCHCWCHHISSSFIFGLCILLSLLNHHHLVFWSSWVAYSDWGWGLRAIWCYLLQPFWSTLFYQKLLWGSFLENEAREATNFLWMSVLWHSDRWDKV